MSLHLVFYDETWHQAWDKFADAHGTIFHKIAWLEALQESFGYQARPLLILDEKKQICGIFPLCLARNLRGQRVGVVLPFTNYLNPICRDAKTQEFLLESLPELQRDWELSYLDLRLDHALPSSVEAGLNDENVTFVLPLSDDEKEILSLASSDNRRRTRLVYQGNWFRTSFENANLAQWYEVFARRQKELGSPSPSLDFFSKICEKMPENVVLLTVLDKRLRKVVGGMFLLADKTTLYYHWGATRIEYNAYHLNHFMYREAIQFSLQNGFQQFDFGRSPRHEKTGTYRFKEQFGAVAKPLLYYRFSDEARSWHNAQQNLQIFIEGWKKTPRVLTDATGHFLIGRALP